MEMNYSSGNSHCEINEDAFHSANSVTSKHTFYSQTEQNVALIWTAALGKKSVLRNQNFFELGGNRSQAIQILKKTHEQFGLNLPLSALIHASTVADFTKLVQGETEKSSISGLRNLHMIKRGDDSTAPLFLIHGHTGDVLIFNKLISQLHPKIPVYAFQWAGWDGGKGDFTVESMASSYKSELLRFKPHGSFKIGGYGMGGLIALELAKQLIDEGNSIDGPLYLFDTPNIKSDHYHSSASKNSNKACLPGNSGLSDLKEQSLTRELKPSYRPDTEVNLLPINTEGLSQHVHDKVVSTICRIKGLPKEIICRIKRLENHLSLLTGEVVPFERRSSYASTSIFSAVRHHEISHYSGSVCYFKSAHFKAENIGMQGCWQDMYLGMTELISGDFKAHVVDSTSVDVMRHPQIPKIINQQLMRNSTQRVNRIKKIKRNNPLKIETSLGPA